MAKRKTHTQLPTGTLTFLFSDIEGSTSLLLRLGEQFTTALEDHQRLLRGAFAVGREVSTEGDSFFVVFSRAADAVAAAVAAQRALAAHPWPSGSLLRVRIGLHTGEARLGGDSYVGLDVHRAARIAAAAHGGQVLLSAGTRALTLDRLPDGVTMVDVGQHRLKDLGTPERLYQLVIEDLQTEFLPPSSLATQPNNLPRELTSFVGREDDRRRLTEMLARAALVTLTGPGGVGKTRLAHRVAAELIATYPDGALTVSFAELNDPGQILPEVARTVGVRDAGPESLEQRLHALLADRRLLLILDNLEHLPAAAQIVARLLRNAPQLRMLITSRSPLRIAGEQAYPVAPLSVPTGGETSAARVMDSPAVELFVQRAIAIDPSFEVTDANAPSIAAICARLDGLPLAIELAASRTRLMTPEDILEHLSQRLDVLGEGPRDLPARQQTLRSAIEWSYGLLDPTDAQLLDRLSVFGGAFDLDAADAIANPGGDLGTDTPSAISTLLEQSLLLAERGHGARRRFRLLQTIRSVAAGRLDAAGEKPAIVRRHAGYFLEKAARLGPRLTQMDLNAATDEIAGDHDNLREAVIHALDRGDAAIVIGIGVAIWRFWAQAGHIGEGRDWIRRALDMPAASDVGPVRARGLLVAGMLAYWQGDVGSFRAAMSEAVDCARIAQDPGLLAETLANFAWGLDVTDSERAVELYREAMSLADPVGRDDVVALCRIGLGQIDLLHGDLDRARTVLIEVLRGLEGRGERNLRGMCLGMLGEIARLRGDLRAAADYYRRVLQLPAPGRSSPETAFAVAAAAHVLVEIDPLLAVRLAGTVATMELQLGMRIPWAALQFTYPPEAVRGVHAAALVDAAYEDGKRLSADEALELVDQQLEQLAAPAPISPG